MAVKKKAGKSSKKAVKKAAAAKPAKKMVKDTASRKAAAKRKAAKAVKGPKKKYELKTQPTTASAEAFIASVENETRRKDAVRLLSLMKKITGEKPTMWGSSIIGFGRYRYDNVSGRGGEWLMTGFSPRAAASVVYVMGGVPETDDLFKRLGKHSMGKSCLYIRRLDDVDVGVLELIVRKSVAFMRAKYPR